MLFLIGIAAATIAGLAAGGKVGRLGALTVTWWWAAPIVLAAQLFAVYSTDTINGLPAIALILATHVALLAIAIRNHALPGAPLVALGLAMNLAVMAANGGLMPIAPDTLERAGRVEAWKIGDGSPGTRVASSKDIILPRDQTRLELLADRFWTGLPGRLSVVFSLGDVVLLSGIVILIVRTMTGDTARRSTITRPESPHVPNHGVGASS